VTDFAVCVPGPSAGQPIDGFSFRDQFVSGRARAVGWFRWCRNRRRNADAHLSKGCLEVFAAIICREDLAATGRIREPFPGGRAGPARRYVLAYVLSHRV